MDTGEDMTPSEEAVYETQNCVFCSKSRADVKKLIAAPNGNHLCDECIVESYLLLGKGYIDDNLKDIKNLLTSIEGYFEKD